MSSAFSRSSPQFHATGSHRRGAWGVGNTYRIRSLGTNESSPYPSSTLRANVSFPGRCGSSSRRLKLPSGTVDECGRGGETRSVKRNGGRERSPTITHLCLYSYPADPSVAVPAPVAPSSLPGAPELACRGQRSNRALLGPWKTRRRLGDGARRHASSTSTTSRGWANDSRGPGSVMANPSGVSTTSRGRCRWWCSTRSGDRPAANRGSRRFLRRADGAPRRCPVRGGRPAARRRPPACDRRRRWRQ